jgi:hypothetical protein
MQTLRRKIMAGLKQMFTGKDNKTLDLGRVLWAKAVIAFLAIGFYGIYEGNPMDYLAFGTGLAAVLAAGGAAIGLKAKTEPGSEGEV